MKIIASILIILALVIGIVPQFSDCESQGRAIELPNGKTIPMKCHWTAQAEMASAGPIFVLGGLMLTSKRKESLRGLTILGIVLGIFVVLLPTYLIGVCASNDMLCNLLMKPTLIFSGTVVGIVSLVGLGIVNRAE
jgi:hypothetical protein